MHSTEHATFDELQLSDAQSLSRMMVENKSRFHRDFPKTLAQNLTRVASAEYIQRKREEMALKKEFTWAIRDNLSTNVVGLLILKELDWQKGIGEFAYCIGESFEGRGWITLAVTKLTKYAFEELKLRTLQIMVHETNGASIKVAEKCGYRWQKRLLKAHTPPDGIALDMELYERYADRR